MLKANGVVWAITADQDCAVKGLIAAIEEVEWKTPEGPTVGMKLPKRFTR